MFEVEFILVYKIKNLKVKVIYVLLFNKEFILNCIYYIIR